MKDTKKRLEKHYLWHIRRINKKLDVFPEMVSSPEQRKPRIDAGTVQQN